MGKILLENMEFYSYHGCFAEEQIIGNRFLVDLIMDTDTSEAETTDNLHKTINYQEVYSIVKNEMEKKSRLLEHIASRIGLAVKNRFPQITHLCIKVSKINPPLGGKIERVSVLLEM